MDLKEVQILQYVVSQLKLISFVDADIDLSYGSIQSLSRNQVVDKDRVKLQVQYITTDYVNDQSNSEKDRFATMSFIIRGFYYNNIDEDRPTLMFNMMELSNTIIRESIAFSVIDLEDELGQKFVKSALLVNSKIVLDKKLGLTDKSIPFLINYTINFRTYDNY